MSASAPPKRRNPSVDEAPDPKPRPGGIKSESLAGSVRNRQPAQASLALRPAGLLNRPGRPLSRGFSPAGHPTKPPVSYQTYRQLSGWILPPLV